MKKSKNLKLWITAGLIIVMAAGSLAYGLGLFDRKELPDGNAYAASTAAPGSGSSGGLSKVAIVRSKAVKAEDIQYAEIKSMVESAVDMAGGFNGLIKDGYTVALKINLVTMKDYCLPNWDGRVLAPEVNGTTTDWRVAKAVVELVRKYDPHGKVYIMEGSAGNTTEFMKHFKYSPEYIPGVDEFIDIAKDSGAWHDFNSDGIVKVSLPNGLLHKEYYLNRKYKQADVLISLPCLKNHWDAVVTGGIKNVGIGATPGNIYGIDPNNPGRNNMVDHSSNDLHMWIRDFYLCRPVNFVIMDGLQGIQNGPTPSYEVSGTDDLKKDQMNMRLILAGRDPIAVDTIESLVMNWDPQSVKYLKYLSDSGAGNLNTAKINVVGKQVDEVRKDFAGVIPKAGGAKVTDKTAPKTVVGKYGVKDGRLDLSLKTDKDMVKAEVYIDGKLVQPIITKDFANCSVDFGGVQAGKHEVTIWSFDRFLNRTENKISVENSTDKKAAAGSKPVYLAPMAATSPVVDGIGNEECWNNAAWAAIDKLWLGQKPSAADFSGRYKIVWTPQKLYYLAEIKDDVLSGPPPDPLVDYYKYDTLELFMDENRSGGDHTYNYNAFAYHIAVNYYVADLGTDQTAHLFSNHVKVLRKKNGSIYTWEAALDIYNDKYDERSDKNKPITLTEGKEMGYALAYCDNDGGNDRESFIGSVDIPGTDKNVAWQNADVFGWLKLVKQ